MKAKIQPKFIFLALLALAIVVVLLYLYFNKSDDEIEASYISTMETADQLYEAREYSEAIVKYQEAIEIDPTKAEAYYGINQVMLDKNLDGRAISSIESAKDIISNSDLAGLYYEVGEYFASKGEWEKASENYLLSYSYDKKDAENLNALVLSQINTGKLDQVEGYLSKIDDDQSKYRTDWNTYTNLKESEEKDLFAVVDQSRIFVNKGMPYLAVELLKSVEVEMEEYWDGWYILGRAYFDIGNSTEAESSLNTALRLGSEEPGLYLSLGRVSYLNGENDQAYTYYERAYAFAVDELRELIGEEYTEILLKEGSYAQALEVAESELSEEGSDGEELQAWRYITMLKVYIHRDEADKISDLVEMDLSVNISDQLFLSTLGEYYLEEENIEAAEVTISKLKDIDQYDPNYYLLQGKLNLLKENPVDAKINFEKAMQYDLVGEASGRAKPLLEQL